MIPELEGTQTGAFLFEVTARPEHGPTVTLYVGRADRGFAVKNRPDAVGFISQHRTFEAAVKSSTFRAKRYLKAYSKPRVVAAAS